MVYIYQILFVLLINNREFQDHYLEYHLTPDKFILTKSKAYHYLKLNNSIQKFIIL